VIAVPSHPDIVRISLPTPFPVGPVNVFLVKQDPPVLIDAGANTDEAYERLEQRLADQGLSVRDIGVVLLTHGHIDHIGMVNRIVHVSGATSGAHPDVVAHLRAYEDDAKESLAFFVGIMRRCGVPSDTIERICELRASYKTLVERIDITRELRDGDEAAGLRALHVPGHSPSDILFYDPVRRLAFTGDHVLKGVSPSPLIRRPRPGEAKVRTLAEYRQSLQRTRALDMDVCYPGHGSPFGNHREIIDSLLRRQERFTQQVYALLGAGPFTPHQLMGMLFPRVAMDTLHFGLSSVLGHLEILEECGMVASEERDGILYFSRRPTEIGVKTCAGLEDEEGVRSGPIAR